MRKPSLVVLSLVAGLSVGVGAPAAASAAPSAKAAGSVTAASFKAPVKRPFAYAGTVSAVDATASTVTIAQSGWTTTLAVSATAAVTVDKVAATLADVSAGARIVVTGTTSGTTRTATKLTVTTTWSFRLDGTVGAADADAGTVDVVRGDTTQAVPVAADATVVIDGAAATLADVPSGARIHVTGTVTNGTLSATALSVTTTWTFRLDALVDAADADAGTLSVLHGDEFTAIPVDAAATVTVDGVTAGLADVPAGARVRVSGTVTNGVLSATTLKVVTTWTFALDGRVGSVDTTDGTITVARRGGSVTVPVDPAARIRQNSRTTTLAGLTTGAVVRVTGTVTNSVENATRIDAVAFRARG